jgi:hypothetical protein
MKALTKAILAMLLAFMLGTTAQAAEPFPCRFDSYFAGELENATQVPEGYLIELLAGGDSMEYLVPKNAPEYQDTVQFVQKAQKADMPPEGAFLMDNNAVCGFTPMFRDEVVLKSHKRDGDRYILSVCTDETSDCYTLRISAGNPLFGSAENVIKQMAAAPSGVEFNNNFEILGTYTLEQESSAAPILLWHSNTGWVQGMCSYQLTFDGQGIFFESATGVERLTLSVDVFDAQGNRLASDTIDTEPFADSNATRMAISYWEGDCEAKRIVIWKAEAVIDGSKVDLLKAGQLRVEESPLKEAIELIAKR